MGRALCRSSTSKTRATWGVLVLVALVCGCCVTPPPADRYFDRSTPVDTVKMFQYGVEVSQYEHACPCLTPASQEAFPCERLWLVLDREIEELGGLTFRQLIIAPERFLVEGGGAGGRAVVQVMSDDVIQDIVLVRVGDEWLIDLDETLARMGVQ